MSAEVARLRQELFVAFTSLNLIAGLNRNIERKITSFLEGPDQSSEQLGDEYLFLELLARYYSELQSFDLYLDQKELIGAAASCRELKSLIERLEDISSSSEENNLTMPDEVYQILEEQYILRSSCILKLAAALEKEFFSFNMEKISIKSRVLQVKNNRFHDTPVELHDFLSMLDVLNMSTSFNAKLARILFIDWNPSHCLFQLTRSSQSCTLSKTIVASRDATEADVTAANLQALAIFITTCIFPVPYSPNEHFMSSWSQFVLKKRDILMGCSELALQTLNTVLTDTGMINNLEYVFRLNTVQERRLDLLQAVKEILSSKDFNCVSVCEGTERVGIAKLLAKGSLKISIDPVFQLGPLNITQKTERLIDLIYSTLAELSLTCYTENIELIQMARDALDLYRLECPELPGSDCRYICHHLTVLGILCKDYLSPIESSPCFLDFFILFQY